MAALQTGRQQRAGSFQLYPPELFSLLTANSNCNKLRVTGHVCRALTKAEVWNQQTAAPKQLFVLFLEEPSGTHCCRLKTWLQKNCAPLVYLVHLLHLQPPDHTQTWSVGMTKSFVSLGLPSSPNAKRLTGIWGLSSQVDSAEPVLTMRPMGFGWCCKGALCSPLLWLMPNLTVLNWIPVGAKVSATVSCYTVCEWQRML